MCVAYRELHAIGIYNVRVFSHEGGLKTIRPICIFSVSGLAKLAAIHRPVLISPYALIVLMSNQMCYLFGPCQSFNKF